MIPTFTVDMASTLAPFGWAMVVCVGSGLAVILAAAMKSQRPEPDVPESEPSEEPAEETEELRPAA
jgi:hypothetical protein